VPVAVPSWETAGETAIALTVPVPPARSVPASKASAATEVSVNPDGKGRQPRSPSKQATPPRPPATTP
jgi:hypothetical protein